MELIGSLILAVICPIVGIPLLMVIGGMYAFGMIGPFVDAGRR